MRPPTSGILLVFALAGICFVARAADQPVARDSSVAPETLVIYDTLASGNPSIDGRTPDKTNAPGGKWTMFRDDFNEDAWVHTGIAHSGKIAQNFFRGKDEQGARPWLDAYPESFLCLPAQRNGSAVVAIPISSSGAYTKPQTFTISADLGGYRQANIALGFFPSVPQRVKNFYVAYDKDYKLFGNFNGLIFTSWDNPNINVPKGAAAPAIPDQFGFVQREQDTGYMYTRLFDLEGAPNGALTLFKNGKAVLTVKYTGDFDAVKPHRLSYDVDTATGAISNVKLQGSTSDYSVFKSKVFTDAATAYAAVGNTPAPEGNASQTAPHQAAPTVLVNNFRVGVNLGPTLPLPQSTPEAPPAAPPPVAATAPANAPAATPPTNASPASPPVATAPVAIPAPAPASIDATPVVTPAPAGTKPLKVFLLAGQSNMMGFGARTGELPADLKQPKDVLVWQGGAWVPLEAKTFKNGCGPEFSFGQAMAQYLGEPVGLIKVIRPLEAGPSSASLAKGWTPDAPQGPLYATLIQEVKDSQKDRPIVVAGMLWDQGSADQMAEAQAPVYQKNLTHFIESIRQVVANPILPFVCGQENDHRGNEAHNPHIDLIRKAQAAIDVPAYRCFNQDDLPRVDNTPPALAYNSHNDHYTTPGQVESGKRYAVVMIDLLKAAGINTNGPVPATSQPIAPPVTTSPPPPVPSQPATTPIAPPP